jgi:heme exporter protein D
MIAGNQDALFIVWAYAGVGLVTLALIGWVWLQSRAARARLAALEAQGIRRRSAGTAA